MCDFPVLLGLCVYFLLTSAFPLGDHHHAPDESFLASNISNSRAVIVDTTANDYLTLLSAPFDVNNPNPVDKGYRYDASSGKGTTIFVVDSGFNLDKYPDEQCLDQRRIDRFLVPAFYREIPITGPELQEGYYYPSDNMDDVVPDPVSKKPRGHGTQVSILAAGCKTGVARNANLYLIKMSAALMKEGLIQGVDALPAASLFALRHIRTVISGSVPGVSVPRGKAVLVMSGSWEIDVLKRKYPAIWESMLGQIKTALEDLDRLGVVVAIAAGNGGVQFGPTEDPNFVPTYVDQQFPTVLATPDNPIILVGATNNRGQLSDFTSPGRAAIPISLYAQGEGIRTYDFLSPELKMKLGTSFSAPIVGGLAAYTLGLDSNPCPYNSNPAVGEDSVGMCIKKYLIRTAFQRVDSNNLLAEDPSQYKYPIPPSILVASNGASEDTEQEGGGNPDADPTPCWSDDTRMQCKMVNMTGTGFEK